MSEHVGLKDMVNVITLSLQKQEKKQIDTGPGMPSRPSPISHQLPPLSSVTPATQVPVCWVWSEWVQTGAAPGLLAQRKTRSLKGKVGETYTG